jgi:hypothetical protein
MSERLWNPWRMDYMRSARESSGEEDCVFCELLTKPDEEAFVLKRTSKAFAVMNLYPYTTGHLLVAPQRHIGALTDLVRQGKVRYIGNSNFPAWRIAEAEYVARAMNVSRFVSCQDEYSLVVRDIEKDLLPAAQEYNLGLLPFFPLASGLLTGKYQRGQAAPAGRLDGDGAELREILKAEAHFWTRVRPDGFRPAVVFAVSSLTPMSDVRPFLNATRSAPVIWYA